MANKMTTLNELNAERTRQAENFFHPQMMKHWRELAKEDATKDEYKPLVPDLSALAIHVYTMAWCKRRDELGRAERDAAEGLVE